MTLDAALIEKVAAAFSDSLLIPEESTPRMYRATAPFLTFLFHGDTGLDGSVREVYPHAFAANLINDVGADKLAAHRDELVDSLRLGDVLMVHSGYWHANDAVVMNMYRETHSEQK